MAKHAKVTLTGCITLNVGSLRLHQGKTIVVTDGALITQLKGQSGVSVEEFDPAPAAKAAGKAEAVKAAEEAKDSDQAEAQSASRRNVRPARGAQAQG